MSKGLGDERFVANLELFKLLNKVAKKHARFIDLGGNASTMAARAFVEGCRIKIGFPLGQEYFEKYFGNDYSRVQIPDGLKEINDHHLSLNYYITDKIWDLEIPRSNRIFLNHDTDNNKMTSLDTFAQNIEDVDIIALGGTQLPNVYSHFIEKLTKLNETLSLPQNKEKQVHLESSAFSNYTFYDTQFDILLHRV